MARFVGSVVALAAIAGITGWIVTSPADLDADTKQALGRVTADPQRGEDVFWAAGCASCHAANGATGEEKLILSGGQRFATDFGTFIAPNISPDPLTGIGGWTLEDFTRAVTQGVSPGGQHYYPAFPYTAYQHMTLQDVADLKAFMDTLPHADVPSAPAEVGFPFNIRRGMGAWKALYMKDEWVLDTSDPQLTRGRYLVEALAHCGECHTPRGPLGGLDTSAWLAGAPNPDGRGTVPGITPGALTWPADDITYYLETGFTPDFDSAGGKMASVVDNFSHLSGEDRAAVAAYLKAIPPVN